VFFDDYPRFRQTSQVAASKARLNLRYEAIIGANRDILAGARVLDLACNDGRWSFAALQSGASHVRGIEARPELCEQARQTMERYGVAPGTYRFDCGDIYEQLRDAMFEVDVVLCLGYLYHTYRDTELLHHLRRLDPRYLIIDTHVIAGETRPLLQVKSERPYREGAAVLDPYAHHDQTLVTTPSLSALVKLVSTYEFGVEDMCDWPSLLARHPGKPGVGDYAAGRRVTLRCRLGAPNIPDLPAAPARAPTAGSANVEEPAEATGSPNRSRPGWRDVVNRGLSRATGYRLTRSGR
jgi:SAM-dependent methyltransferase